MVASWTCAPAPAAAEGSAAFGGRLEVATTPNADARTEVFGVSSTRTFRTWRTGADEGRFDDTGVPR
ncbi:hypothetical protein [Streptomyces pratensis]|uniref:hypothetical protein n=1 Tax=Streptomyces pratensis TaxID=1169025 RepID=UPI003015B0D0